MIRDHDVASPALLCHKEPAQCTQSSILGRISCFSLVLYGKRAIFSVHESHLSCHNNTPKATKCLLSGHFSCLELCCYGIDLGANIVRFNQSEHGIWSDLDQWECSALLGDKKVWSARANTTTTGFLGGVKPSAAWSKFLLLLATTTWERAGTQYHSFSLVNIFIKVRYNLV